MKDKKLEDRKYSSYGGWVRVIKESDCPEDDSYEDYPREYILRVYHDDRGSHIETAQANEIWAIAKGNDGAVLWLDESVILKP